MPQVKPGLKVRKVSKTVFFNELESNYLWVIQSLSQALGFVVGHERSHRHMLKRNESGCVPIKLFMNRK